jgi:hypothetical protein
VNISFRRQAVVPCMSIVSVKGEEAEPTGLQHCDGHTTDASSFVAASTSVSAVYEKVNSRTEIRIGIGIGRVYDAITDRARTDSQQTGSGVPSARLGRLAGLRFAVRGRPVWIGNDS